MIRSKRGTPITAAAKAREIWLNELKELEEDIRGFLVNAACREATEEEKSRVAELLSDILRRSKELV